ncbi:hypothetical protein [Alienimonas californiensis]|uniref:Stigma-specific protein, Stig1 n=1 Tax=Alienimonas californiensis TaxID=2527989 RepID=A0A517P6A6_9PLAN|nr:hypothetical protein [Alienimonas californiensis]QDT14903.1 hypothetical protein CA12_09830 [Alienimonas californiensis]
MRLQSAAPRALTGLTAHATPRPLRRRLANLLTLCLLAAPVLSAGSALADDAAEPAAEAVDARAAAEGVVSLTDIRRDAASRTDAAVQPAGLLNCHDEGCVDVCDLPCGSACHGCTCDGGVCTGGCGHGSCGHGRCGPGGCGLFGHCGPSCPPGYGYGHGGGPGLCLPGLPIWNHCPPDGCPPGGCPPGHCPPGLCLPGHCPLGLCLPGHCPPGLCLPGQCLLPGMCAGQGCGWLSHLCGKCGGHGQCYWCSLVEVDQWHGKYEHVYAVDPNYRDRRTGDVWASQTTGVPMAVPLAPNVRHTMEYGWGMPSSRLVPISRPLPPSSLYGPPPGTTVELPTSHPRHGKTLPYIPEHGQGHLPRTGIGFPRTLDNAGNS